MDRLETLCAVAAPANTNSVGTWRPDVVVAEAALRKAESDCAFRRPIRIPDPTVLAQYEHEPPDNPNSVGFSVSLPVPLWNRNRGNILAAEAAGSRPAWRLKRPRPSGGGHCRLAPRLRGCVEAVAELPQSIRPKSEQIRQTMAYAYQKGGASLLDLLVAERNDNDIRLAAAQAASDTAATAPPSRPPPRRSNRAN